MLDHAVALARCSDAVLMLARVVAHAPLVFFEPPLSAYPVSAVDPDATRKNVEMATEELDRMAKQIAARDSLRVETAVMVGDVAAETILDLAKSTSRRSHRDDIAWARRVAARDRQCGRQGLAGQSTPAAALPSARYRGSGRTRRETRHDHSDMTSVRLH